MLIPKGENIAEDSTNSPRRKNMISTGNFHSMRINLLNFSSNFVKMAVFKTSKADLSNCETIIFVDQIQSTPEEVKVQLYFLYLYTPCIKARVHYRVLRYLKHL